MCFGGGSSPPPPPPAPEVPKQDSTEVKMAQEKVRKVERTRAGRESTILAGAAGADTMGQETIRRRKLMGMASEKTGA